MATAPSRCAPRSPTAQVEWVLQAEQLGTGHAVQQACRASRRTREVLILYGDVPLVRAGHAASACSMRGATASP